MREMLSRPPCIPTAICVGRPEEPASYTRRRCFSTRNVKLTLLQPSPCLVFFPATISCCHLYLASALKTSRLPDGIHTSSLRPVLGACAALNERTDPSCGAESSWKRIKSPQPSVREQTGSPKRKFSTCAEMPWERRYSFLARSADTARGEASWRGGWRDAYTVRSLSGASAA